MHAPVALTHSAEELLIGCLLDDPSILGRADIRPGLWHDERARTVWRFLIDWQERHKGQDCDPIRVQSDLMRDLPGVVHWALGVLAAIPSPESWPHWLGIAREQAGERHRMALAKSLEGARQSEELEKVHQRLGTLIRIRTELAAARERGPLLLPPPDPTVLAIARAIQSLDAQIEGKEGALGVKTHLPTFDRLTGGLKKGELVVLAARPGEGKTTLALNLLNAVSRGGRVPSSMVSLEMPTDELLVVLAHIHSGVRRSEVSQRTIGEEDCGLLARTLHGIGELGLRFHDRLTRLTEIERAIGQDVAQNGTRVAFVDYLQRVRVPEQRDRWMAVAETSNRLKNLAMELGITVVALAQLSRTPEQEGRAPRLGDLRGSAEIEADADVVGILHREKDGNINLNLSKVRRGARGMVAMFSDFDRARMGERASVVDSLDAPE